MASADHVTVNEPDYSVSSSRNTTIIRISGDPAAPHRPTFRYFDADDALGVPEQV